MPSPKKSDTPRQKTVSFRLPEHLVEELKALAKKNRRTFSGELQLAIEKHLERNGPAERDGQPLK